MTVKYCPADSMIGDHFTKPLQGDLFKKFRSVIMNIDLCLPDCHLSWEQIDEFTPPNPQECVGEHKSLSEVEAQTKGLMTVEQPVEVTCVSIQGVLQLVVY